MAVSFPIAKPLATPSRAGIGGPKSAAGKARSAANAVKHGLASANPVILEYETVEEWESFRDAFATDLHPQGPVEAELARELALIQWRRRRLPAYEARSADRRLQTAIASLEYYAERESQPELEERARVVLNDALLPNTEELTRLLRYEAHLDRKFTQTLRHLHRLQQTRKQAAAAEIYKTNSPAPPPVPAGPTPTPTPTPTLPPPNHPPAVSDKTNSTPAAAPQLAQPVPGAAKDSTHQAKPPTEPKAPSHPARTGPSVVPLAGGQLDDRPFRPSTPPAGNASPAVPRAESTATATRT